jgi:hypothetical protein
MTLLGWLGAGIAGAWSLCLAASALVPGPELDRSSRTSGRLRAGRVSAIVPMRDEAGNAEARFSGRSPLWGATAPLGTTAVVGITIASWRRTAQGSLRWRGRAYGATR